MAKTSAGSQRRQKPHAFTPEELGRIRSRLERERRTLTEQIEEMERAAFEGDQTEVAGELGMDDDFADAGSATFERERDLSIQNNIRDLIDQIDRALRRVDEGTYGTCERCGNPIESARLKALPHALLCMTCKRREERTR